MSVIFNIPHSLPMAYVRSPILIGDNNRECLIHQPWIHGTSLMWAPHVWCCVTDCSSLTALLEYLFAYKIEDAYLIFDRCVVARSYQQTRFIVPVESAGADRVLIVPEDSGSHRLREDQGSANLKFRILLWLKTSVLSDFLDECLFYSISAMVIQHWFRYYLAKKMQQANMSINDASVFHRRCVNRPQ